MSNNNTIEAIIFDLGRVLIDIDLQRGIFGLFNHTDKDGAEVIAKIMADPAVKLHNCGKISSHEFHRHINEYLELELDFKQFTDRWCDIFSPIPEMAKLVEQISKKYKVGLLSDTDPLHWGYTSNKFDYLKIFANPALSYKLGITKPNKEIFFAACELTGSLPENTLFIDDVETNVQGAISAGLQAFRHITPAKTIEKLKEYISF